MPPICYAKFRRYASVRWLRGGPRPFGSEAARRGLSNVVLVPAQPKEMMPSYWSLCDLALVHLKDTPLFRTVIPSKIFEAMAMGRPIVLSAPDGEAADIVRGTGAGIVLPPEIHRRWRRR